MIETVEIKNGVVEVESVGVSELTTGDRILWDNEFTNTNEICQIFVDETEHGPICWALHPRPYYGWIQLSHNAKYRRIIMSRTSRNQE